MNEIIKTNGLDKDAQFIDDTIILSEQCKADIRQSYIDLLDCYILIGERLYIVKRKLNNCDLKFGEWRKNNFPNIHPNKLTSYMHIYDRQKQIQSMLQHGLNSKLMSETTFLELAAPSTSDSVVEQVEEKLANGEKITRKEIRNMKKDDNEIQSMPRHGLNSKQKDDNEILLHVEHEVESKGVLDHIKARKQQKEAALRKDLSKELLPVFKDMLERMLSMSKEKRERTMQDFINSVAKL